ncbi:MAG: hypothetical protein AA931_04495 [Peptococcaceae bacterium 1109]|jgi:cytochrome c-type biogenesis protein|nr:MAG: hypothetical protein AA931_04495 [Peptococcaceae bacterium 1109]
MLPEVTPALFGLVFVDGLLTFVSPCILPMLPIYLMYLSGTTGEEVNRARLIRNTIGFVLGFTVVFVILGGTASIFGSMVFLQRELLARISGLIVIVFGLSFMGILRIGFLNRAVGLKARTTNLGFWSSLIFGGTFSLGWTPCLTAFLGTALLLASNTSTAVAGMALLFVYGMGLGVPFLLAALLWQQLQKVVGFIRRNLAVIQKGAGLLLVLTGVLMVTGHFQRFVGLFY